MEKIITFNGSSLIWSTEDIFRLLSQEEGGEDIKLTIDEAESILFDALEDNEEVMTLINECLRDSITEFIKNR